MPEHPDGKVVNVMANGGDQGLERIAIAGVCAREASASSDGSVMPGTRRARG
jgi:hypothetical protein